MKIICNGYKYLSFESENNQSMDSFSGQTLEKTEEPEDHGLWVISSGLYGNIRIPSNVLEKMAWALLTRPRLDIMIQPVHTRIETKLPEIVENLPNKALNKIMEAGFIAIFPDSLKTKLGETQSPQDLINKVFKSGYNFGFFSRPLSDERIIIKRPETKSHKLNKIKTITKDKVRTSFHPEVRMHLKNFLHKIRPENIFNYYPPAYPDIACRKSWEPCIPDIKISVRDQLKGDRIPVLMAMHWLEVSGAERFAIELVRHLPKEKYAVYLITDVLSENPWEHLVKEHVEEIFHLPDFLEMNLFKCFYVHFLESRNIKLAHINHAPEFYRSLAHIRRFNQDVKIIDSLYIIELPPQPGGYPDFSARFAEPFLDMHHVACLQIKDFLSQRWLVPDKKMSLIYLNVDIDEFDPEKIQEGNFRKKYGISEESCLVAFIGRFAEQKRPEVFVETVAKILNKLSNDCSKISFLMAGSGYLDAKVKERISNLGLNDRIILTGNISELKSFYRDIDLLVMPSANEGVALVTFESMAMETPIVFADVGAQSELLPKELLVDDSKNEKELAKKFAEKCLPFILDKEKRLETGKKLRRHIVENHNDKMTYTAFEKLYDKLFKNNCDLKEKQ